MRRAHLIIAIAAAVVSLALSGCRFTGGLKPPAPTGSADMVNVLNEKYPGRISLWDFSVCTPVLAEAWPKKPGGRMKYFFDANHFTPEFGHIIMREILDKKRSADYQGRLIAPGGGEFSRNWQKCETLLDPQIAKLVEDAAAH